MNLTEMFYGKFEPPRITRTRKHRLGFVGEPRHVPLQYKKERCEMSFEERLSKAAKQVLSLLRMQVKPITGDEMARKTPYTRNYCSQLMYSFVKEGLAVRIKISKPNTKLYAYKAVKND
jgi:hypothetical protein